MLPFVDVVYAAVLSYGVLRTGEYVERLIDAPPPLKGTPLLLLIITSVYLIFDYGSARICTEAAPYKGLSRFTVDLLIAFAFLSCYIAALRASVHFLLALGLLLLLGGCWIYLCKSEYPGLLPNWRFVLKTHLIPSVLLLGVWMLASVVKWKYVLRYKNWLLPGAGGLFLLWSFFVSYLGDLGWITDLEMRLLPVIPLFRVLRASRNLLRMLRRETLSAFSLKEKQQGND